MGISTKIDKTLPYLRQRMKELFNINDLFHASEPVAIFSVQLFTSVSYNLQTYGP